MAVYDVFLNNKQPEYVKKLLISNAERLIKYVFDKYNIPKDGSAKVLEIGPGKGYFYKAFNKLGMGQYYAMDRNVNILSALGIGQERIINSSFPNIDTEEKFDLIFVGFVIEHLKNGIELFESLSELKKRLSDDGVIIIQFPDCMKLGMEFWNIDYTHALPTTKRNVNQAIVDSGLIIDRCIDISGILYTRVLDSKILYGLKRILLFLYSYRLMSFLFRPIYRVPLYDLQNLFWRVYALLKEPNVMIFVKNDDKSK